MLPQESSLPMPPSGTYRELDAISKSLESGHLLPAIQWAEANRDFLLHRSSSFEFELHRSQFIRIATGQLPLLAATQGEHLIALDPDGDNIARFSSGAEPPSAIVSPIEQAVCYGRTHLRRHLHDHLLEIQALYSFILYLPQSVPADPDAGSPSDPLAYLREVVPYSYHDFLDPTVVHSPYLVPRFQIEFCACNKLARDAPLKTTVEIGAGGALLKIMKVRQVMKMRGNEWSQANELPVSCAAVDIVAPESRH